MRLEDKAYTISQDVLRIWCRDVDERNRFPTEGIEALRNAGLLGFCVPVSLGGLGGDVGTYSRIATILASECPSTAMIWAMHCQHVAMLAMHAADRYGVILAKVAKDGDLVASVTSEYGLGGNLFESSTPLIKTGRKIRVHREAPIVSFGDYATYFLIKMQASEIASRKNVVLILGTRDMGEVSVLGGWNAMGMRGTQSVPMRFELEISEDEIVHYSFSEIATKTLIPMAHIGWSSVWFGAAQGAYRRTLKGLRRSASRGHRRNIQENLLLSSIAESRMQLDIIDSCLKNVINQEKLKPANDSKLLFENNSYNILLNNLKIISSRYSFSIVNSLIELIGLSQGYLKNESTKLEQTFRDLRSASLMYGNDRLLEINGKLSLIEVLKSSSGQVEM